MTTIDPSADVVTLINVFTVAPADQQRLLAVLTEATTAVVAGLPGFISANFHRSLDGSRVTNYAQWRSRKDLEAMRAHPAAAAHLREAATIAIGVEPHLYEVTAVVAAGAAPASRLAGVSASQRTPHSNIPQRIGSRERPDLAGATLAIGGPEALTGGEVAARLAAALGRPVRYEAIPLDAFEAGLAAAVGAAAATAIAGIYRWDAERGDGRRTVVDPNALLAALPVPLTPLAEWARGRDWAAARASAVAAA